MVPGLCRKTCIRSRVVRIIEEHQAGQEGLTGHQGRGDGAFPLVRRVRIVTHHVDETATEIDRVEIPCMERDAVG